MCKCYQTRGTCRCSIMAKPNDRTCRESFNPHLPKLASDRLHHIGYSRDEAKDLFRDVKFVVMGGSAKRMASFAELVAKKIGYHTTDAEQLDISRTDRFCFYKIGPVISINNGMGVPSLTILLHEILKLLHYAGAKNPVLIRIGTSGGLGVAPGSLVISEKAVNAFFREEHETVILGKTICRPVVIDRELAEDLFRTQKDFTYNTLLGTTICIDDFYEGQGRLNGAFCDITEEERLSYLKEIHSKGVVNIEMEATALTALCHKADYRCAVVCVTLLDRLKGDQVELDPEVYKNYVSRPQELVAQYIKEKLRQNEIDDSLMHK